MKRVFALALVLFTLTGCGAAGNTALPTASQGEAMKYLLDEIEIHGFPAVSGGEVYGCAEGSCAAVWPEAGAPLDAPEGFRATSLSSGSEGGVWTLDIYWDEDYAEHIELCLHRLEGGCESFEDGWLGGVTDMCWSDGSLWLACADGYVLCLSEDFKLLFEYELENVMGLAATGSGVNLKYREKAGVTFANLSTDGSLTPGPAALTEDCVLQDALEGWLWTDTRGLVRDTDSGAEYIVLWADSGLVFSAASLWVAELGEGFYAVSDGSAAGVLRPAADADSEQP